MIWKSQQDLTRRKLMDQAGARSQAQSAATAVTAMAAPRASESRVELCCMCRSHISIAVVVPTDPQEPEMIQVPAQVWSGIVESQSGKMQLVMCCSAGCLEQFTARGVAYPPF
jgi:hypothetical protein